MQYSLIARYRKGKGNFKDIDLRVYFDNPIECFITYCREMSIRTDELKEICNYYNVIKPNFDKNNNVDFKLLGEVSEKLIIQDTCGNITLDELAHDTYKQMTKEFANRFVFSNNNNDDGRKYKQYYVTCISDSSVSIETEWEDIIGTYLIDPILIASEDNENSVENIEQYQDEDGKIVIEITEIANYMQQTKKYTMANDDIESFNELAHYYGIDFQLLKIV